MKNILLLITLTAAVLLTSCSTKKEIKPPRESIMNNIKAEVQSFGEDRWLSNEVYFNKEINSLVIKISVSPLANNLAIKGYCNQLQQIYYDNLQSRKFLGMIFQGGKKIKSITENTRC